MRACVFYFICAFSQRLNEKNLIMYKYAVDSFDQITLDFQVMIKRKLWGGTIEIAPDEIEYVWE